MVSRGLRERLRAQPRRRLQVQGLAQVRPSRLVARLGWRHVPLQDERRGRGDHDLEPRPGRPRRALDRLFPARRRRALRVEHHARTRLDGRVAVVAVAGQRVAPGATCRSASTPRSGAGTWATSKTMSGPPADLRRGADDAFDGFILATVADLALCSVSSQSLATVAWSMCRRGLHNTLTGCYVSRRRSRRQTERRLNSDRSDCAGSTAPCACGRATR